MAIRIPTYDTAQVAPTIGAAPLQSGQSYDTGATGRQLEQAGGALQDAAGTLTGEEVFAQNMANQVKVDAALNTVRQQQQALTYDPDNGYLAKRGSAALDPDPLGRSLPQQYGEQLQDTISSTSASLGNEAQRRVFSEQVAPIATSFSGQVQSHMLSEFTSFGMQTQDGTIKLAADAAKGNWDKPDLISPQVASAQAAVWKKGQIAGTPANLVQAEIQQTTSAIHSGVIEAALTNNEPAYALAYINAKKGEMTADDLLKANSVIKADMRARVATSTAQGAMDSLRPQLAPTDGDKVVQITAQAESGGQERNPDGTYVTSPAGAKGKMQVMDGTNANPGFGVTPAADNSDAERTRVGHDYILALAKNYGGDMSKAWAAYNAGPGTVDKAVKANPQNWLSAMPAETQSYVAGNVAKLQQAASPPIPSLQDVHDKIRASLGDNPDPKVLAASLAEGARMYTDFTNNRKVTGENTVLAAQQWLIKNNGNFAALPPDLASAVTANAPDKYDDLVKFSKVLARGENATNMPAYLDAVAHPDELAKMSDATFNQFATTNFSQADGKRIANMRQDEINGKTDTSAGGLNRPALNSVLNNRLTSIGINPAPKDLGEKARVGSIQKFVTDDIFAQQQQLGRKMTQAEVSDHVDQLFAQNITFKNSFLGIPTGTSVQPVLGTRVSDIPASSLTQIRSALAAAGNPRPSDDQVIRTYFAGKTKR